MRYFITDDHTKLAYFDRGSGIPVVLIAGYGAPAGSWILQVKPLTKAGYRVIGFDRRSHGRSQNSANGHSMERHADDLKNLLDHLKLERPVLVGQSMGASVIFAYLAKYGDEQVRAVVDIDQTPRMRNSRDWINGMYGLDDSSIDHFFEKPLPTPIHKPINKGNLLKIALAMLGNPKFDDKGTYALLVDHARADWMPTLPSLNSPILFLAGADSPFWPSAHTTAAAALCKNGKAVIVENCGHAVNWEQPTETNRVLLSFLDDVC